MDTAGFPIIRGCFLSPKLTPPRFVPPTSKAANSRLRLNCAAVSKALPTTRRPVPACAALSGGRHDLRSRLTPRHPLPQPSVRRRNHRDYLHSPAYPAVAATAAWDPMVAAPRRYRHDCPSQHGGAAYPSAHAATHPPFNQRSLLYVPQDHEAKPLRIGISSARVGNDFRPSQRFEASGNAVWAAGLALPVMSVVLDTVIFARSTSMTV